MATYRPVDIRIWTDRKFLSLSDDGRMLWLFLLTTTFTRNIPGVIVAGEAALAEELGWSTERFRKGFAELVKKRLSVVREGRLLWLVNALKYQPIAGPNSIKGMAKRWDDIPDGPLKASIWQALKVACKSWDRLFAKGFPEPIVDSSSNGSIQDQEQDQEQEQEQDQEQNVRSPRSRAPSPPGQLDLVKTKVDKLESEHHRALFAFDAYFQRTHGGAKPSWKGKNSKLISVLVKSHGADEVTRRLGVLEASPPRFPPAPWDMPTFAQHFDKVAAPASIASGRVEPRTPDEYPEGDIAL
jgi:hypothetical protein